MSDRKIICLFVLLFSAALAIVLGAILHFKTIDEAYEFLAFGVLVFSSFAAVISLSVLVSNE